ncbi:Phospholipase A2 [Halotydeus destructor]|nr:Phospholipase A2 [Halotydeus destructor]
MRDLLVAAILAALCAAISGQGLRFGGFVPEIPKVVSVPSVIRLPSALKPTPSPSTNSTTRSTPASVDSVTRSGAENATYTVPTTGQSEAPVTGSPFDLKAALDRLTPRNLNNIGSKYAKKTVYVEHSPDGTGRKRMVEIVTQPNIVEIGPPKVVSCQIYGDPGHVSRKLEAHKPETDGQLNHVTSDVMRSLVDKCQKHVLKDIYARANATKVKNSNGPQNGGNETDTETDGGEGGPLDGLVIYPGTKWCGAGNIAEDYDDLGYDKMADACCREHDHCNSSISAKETKFNLTNTDSYTKSACECDVKFSDCLKEANTHLGHMIGRTYFNVLQTQCFREDFPIVSCREKKGFVFDQIQTACQDYELDTTKPKATQFFDPPFYAGDKGPLIYIPGVSDFITEPLVGIKDKLYNRGIFGEVIG